MHPLPLVVLFGACTPVDPSGSEVSATAEATTSSQAAIVVERVSPGPVAAACVSRDDPDEAHLLEVTGDGPVDFRFSGLLPNTKYDCSVAMTDPPGPPSTVSFLTARAPSGITVADATSSPELAATGAYTVMNIKPECIADNVDNYLTVLDADGNNRFSYALPQGLNAAVEVAPDGPGRFLWGGGADGAVGAPEVVDVNDGPLWKLTVPDSDGIDWHHDVRRIADGRVLSVEQQLTDTGWRAFQLRLVDDAGVTSWLYDARDAVADGWLPAGDAERVDPHHLNWATAVDSGHGLVAYASLCYLRQIIAIDVTTSQPLWRFGAGGDFQLVDTHGHPLGDDEYPQCQHGLQMDGTHLFVYDNGEDRGYTRAVEYTLDTDTMVATETWSWVDDEPFVGIIHGGVEWLTPDHERVLVVEAGSDCAEGGRHSQIVEIDRRDDTVVQRLVLGDEHDWMYRAHRIDGCDLFANARFCPSLATRLDELRPALGL
jgi:hypothetical protein